MKKRITGKIKVGIEMLTHDIGRIWHSGAAHIGVSRWLTQSIGIGQRILLARILGAANIGHIAVTRSALDLIKLPAGAGMFTPVNKITAEESGNIEAQKIVLATGFWFVLCISCVVGLIFLILCKTTTIITDNNALYLITIAIIFLPLISLSELFISFLAGQQKMKIIAKLGAFLSIFGFLSVIPLCYFGGLRGWIINYIGLIVIGFCIYHLFIGIKIPYKINVKVLKRMLRIGLFAVLGQTVGSILLQFDTLCISGIMKDAEATGIYNTAAMASQQLMTITGGVVYTVFPHIAKNRQDIPKLRQLYKELSRKLFLLSVVAGLCGWFISPWFFALFGPKFNASVIPFQILIIGFLCRVQYVLANTYLDALGRTDVTFVTGLLAAVCNIILNLLFIPKWGIEGAAWATVTSLFFSMLIREAALHYFIFYKRAIK